MPLAKPNPQLKIIYLANIPILSWDPVFDAKSYSVLRGDVKENIEVIETGLEVTEYKDDSATGNLFYRSNRSTMFYNIIALLNGGTEFQYPDIVDFSPNLKYPIQGVLNRVIQLNRKRMTIGAEYCDLYLKKGAGDRCPTCWNKITGSTSSPKELCPICFNTGFKGGYNKITALCNIRDSPEEIIQLPQGLARQSRGKQAVMADYPVLRAGDFIVEQSGDRWGCEIVNFSQFHNVITNTISDIIFLESNRIEYLINL